MKMKTFILLLFLVLSLPRDAIAQELSNKNQYLSLSLGQGYDDGIVSLTHLPTIGLGFEKELNRFFSINFRLFSFYRSQPDSYFIEDSQGRPIIDIIVETAFGPIITQSDKEKITNIGIKDLDADWTVKMFNLPMIVGINFFPVSASSHQIGLNLGFGLNYSSYNWPRDFHTIKKLELNDGSIYQDLYLSQDTEFKTIEPIDCLGIMYEYKLKNLKIGIRFGSYGLFYSKNIVVWESAIYTNLKI
ncbi:MAG: hypothetical protein IPH57_13700 [Saprospiraceae bacterium]|nr:hypothetical protein [Saprospiraceae bacterium]